MSREKSSYSLVIFASFSQLFFSLLVNDQLLAKKKMTINNNFVSLFFTNLEKFLTTYNLVLASIANIYAGIGPGSYLINRAIITFLKTSKVLNPHLNILTINNLVFQILPQEKTISLLDANQKNFYLMVSDQVDKEIFSSLNKTALPGFLKTYPQYQVHQNFLGFDHWQHFLFWKKKFSLVQDYQKLQAIEL